MGVLFLFLVLAALLLTAYAAWRGAPWVPTPQRAIEAGFNAVALTARDVVIDCGAGDGRVLIAAARRGARAIGYELSPILWLVAWLRTRLHPAGSGARPRVILADGFRADLSSATVLFAFLRPPTTPRLAAVLARRVSDMPIRVLSYAFPLPRMRPDAILRVPGCAPLYRYTITPSTPNA